MNMKIDLYGGDGQMSDGAVQEENIDIETLEDLEYEETKRDLWSFLYDHNLDIGDLEGLIDDMDGWLGNYCDIGD